MDSQGRVESLSTLLLLFAAPHPLFLPSLFLLQQKHHPFPSAPTREQPQLKRQMSMAIRRLEKVRSSDGEQTCVRVSVWAHVLVDEYVDIFQVNHTSGKL